MPDRMPPAKLAPKVGRASSIGAAGLAGAQPFLTRPYWDPHQVTSVFDHCSPDYTRDGRICEFDGTVASSANGVDPTFSAGYAVTPRGSDYLYYDGHNGWDLALNYEPLLAAAPGTVTLAGYDPNNPGFGQTVIIDHGNGFSTRYGHMSQIYVNVGDHVYRTTTIGVSGNTGNSTGPHLHFGVYVTNPWNAIDPWGWTGAGSDPWPYDSGNLWLTGNPQNPLPTAPTAVSTTAGDSSATVTWQTPAWNGGDRIYAYVVTASPGGASATVDGSLNRTLLTGLSNFASYTIAVVAYTIDGRSPDSQASSAVTPVPAFPGRLHPVAPARILDTRSGLGGFSTVAPGQSVALSVLGRGGVPSTGVAAVVLNVTETNPTQAGFLTVYPSATALPNTSNLNFGPWQTSANLVQAALGPDGKVALANQSSGQVDLIGDVSGWIGTSSDGGVDGHYHPVAPGRILDTRTSTGGHPGPLRPGASLTLQVSGSGPLAAVPAAQVVAVALNLTATNPTSQSFLAVTPSGGSAVSNLNFLAWQTVANRVIVPVSPSGQVSIYNSQGSTDVIVDVSGWFSSPAATATSGGLYTGVTAQRLLDTRNGTGVTAGRVGPGQTLTLPVAGRLGVPLSGMGAVLINLTAVAPSGQSYLAVLPSTPAGPPSTSDVNVMGDQNVPNLVIATLGSDGSIRIYNSAGSTDVVADLLGWYS